MTNFGSCPYQMAKRHFGSKQPSFLQGPLCGKGAVLANLPLGILTIGISAKESLLLQWIFINI